jgi:hypothetical protein
MNKYEVVCSIGWNHHVIQNVEARDEKEARKIVWEKELSDNQRNNCEDIEVFFISEKEDMKKELQHLREYLEEQFTPESIKNLRDVLINEYGERYEKDSVFYEKINEVVIEMMENLKLEYRKKSL